MNISQTETRGFTILRIEGKFDTNTAPMVRDTLQRLTGAGVQRILIDFEEVDYMSSIGLQLAIAFEDFFTSTASDFHDVFGRISATRNRPCSIAPWNCP